MSVAVVSRWFKSLLTIGACSLGLTLAPSLAHAAIVYVDDSNTGAEDGSLANPYNTINEGVNNASAGDTISVADGTYNENVYVGSRSDLTLQGQGENTIVADSNAGYKFRVISSQDITIEGFHINGGEDGIYISSSTGVTVRDNKIENVSQYSYSYGGAFCAFSSEVFIHDNIVSNTWGGQRGGAGYFSSCEGEISGNQFLDCDAWAEAGGLYISANGSKYLTVSENFFTKNHADRGGSIHVRGSSPADGGVDIRNNIFLANGADYQGYGDVRVSMSTAASGVNFINNIVKDTFNPCCGSAIGLYVSQGDVTAYNNIFQNNTGYAIAGNASTVTADYNNNYGVSHSGLSVGINSISADPEYVDAASGDYHLESTSQCVDAGHPDSQYNDGDGTQNDIGAFGGLVDPNAIVPTIYVDAGNTSGVEDGSQANPFNTIMEGVNASASGDIIGVADGVYGEQVYLYNKQNLHLIGSGDGTVVQNARSHKFYLNRSSDIIVENFKVSNGEEGMLVSYSTNVVLRNNKLENLSQYSYSSAGAFYLHNSSQVLVDGNVASNCYGGQRGGAGYIYNSQGEFRNNAFYNCTAWNSGGGFYLFNNGATGNDLTFSGNHFQNNLADYSGAIDIRGYNQQVTIDHNTFKASGTDYSWGGAVRVDVADMTSTIDLINNVFADTYNPCCAPAMAVYSRKGVVTAYNNIFVGGEYALFNASSTMTADYNDAPALYYTGVTPGPNSLAVDPLFADPANNDYTLLAGSPVIDAGHPDAQYNDDDGSRNDMGRFGGPQPVSTSGGTQGGGGQPQNSAPVADNQSVTTPEDTGKLITLSATDGDGDTLSYNIVGNPSSGSLSGTPPSVTYTPNANFFGSDSFTFKANDGQEDSNEATVSITVSSVNDVPVANAQNVSTPEDVAKAITLTGSDVEGSALTYSIVANPSSGILSGTAPNVTYTPNANFNGSDSFTFRVNDGTDHSADATVSITVSPVNDLPVASGQSVVTAQDTAKAITLTGSDIDGDSLSYFISANPANGVLSGSGANRVYTPNTGFFGADSFTFYVHDGTANSGIATVSITVQQVLPNSYAENQTFDTDCAEMDNVNNPVYSASVDSFRITATHPLYYPTSINANSEDFTDCEFAERDIWLIGAFNGQYGEFKQSGFSSGDIYYAPDNPVAGTEEPFSEFPRELNASSMTDQYIYFTADENSDFNLEAVIGAKFIGVFSQISGTIEINFSIWNGSGWTSLTNKIYSGSAGGFNIQIPDLSWLEGTDANRIRLHVVSAAEGGATTAGAYARYDYLKLEKRDEGGETNLAELFDNSQVIVEPVQIDFWWRYPDTMDVHVIGGQSAYDVHYVRIIKKVLGINSWPQTLVIYEDGNTRILPHTVTGFGWNPFGTSILFGPSDGALRPAAGIDSITIDPIDFSMDIIYDNGSSAHVEMWVDREKQVVDVSDITYDTVTSPMASVRSMWVRDGNADVDRVESTLGTFPINDDWSLLGGSWWQYYREVPSYHNTYSPDFRIEVMDQGAEFLSREAESADSGIGHSVVSRSNASGGQSLALSSSGGEATFNISLAQNQDNVQLRVRYADPNSGTTIVLGNTVSVYVDGSLVTSTRSANTGSNNSFEVLPNLYIGNLTAGSHTIRIVASSGTQGVELDRLDFVAQPTSVAPPVSVLTRQGESLNSGSGYQIQSRSNATGGQTVAMSASGGSASYSISLPSATDNAYVQLRYADNLGPNKVEIYVDGALTAQFPSESTGGVNSFDYSAEMYLGDLSAGSHTIQIVTSAESQGVEIDEFEIFTRTP